MSCCGTSVKRSTTVPTAGVSLGRLQDVKRDEVPMLWTLSIIFLSIWLLGVATPFTLHGYIHVLLILAIAVILIPFIRRKHARD
jgi:hypothetical protein